MYLKESMENEEKLESPFIKLLILHFIDAKRGGEQKSHFPGIKS